jgi:hypothetical protein
MTRATILAAALLLVLASGSIAVEPEEASAPARLVITGGEETFQGKGTDMVFPKEIVVSGAGQEVSMTALGSGVRKKMVFKVYEGVAFAETAVDLGKDPYSAFIEGDFAKRILMFFERDVGGGKIRGAYEDGFKKVQGDSVWSEDLLRDIDVFLGYFDDEVGVKDQETIDLVWIPGRGLHTSRGGESYPVINNPRLASALWAIWFGHKPVSNDLKRDMFRFLSEEEAP